MADSRVIRVGSDHVGIRGLDRVIAEMAGQFADRPDDEVAAEMMERLQPANFFAPRFRHEYAAALALEFRRKLGRAAPEAKPAPDQGAPAAACGCLKE
jgi:hypothetical protein